MADAQDQEPQPQRRTEVYTGLRGRDGFATFPGEIPKHKALECLNVDFYRAAFARKRGGASNIFSTTTGEAFTGTMSFLGRHQPGADPTAAELWGVDNAATPVVQRLTGGVAFTTPTLKDALTGSAQDVCAVSFNGKYFIACKTAEDRLHVWDTSTVRRTGLATPAAPTVADSGTGGTYAATLRYYKVAYRTKSGSVIQRQSELSAAVSFTPSGSKTAAVVTKPAALSEGETHWVLFGSEYDQIYEEIAETVVGTTTYDDTTEPRLHEGEAPPLVGTHTNWTSVKFLLATDDHLLGLGSWASGGKQSRVWWSGVTGQTGVGDDESVIQTTDVSNYADLNENVGGDGTGLGLLDGGPVVFKRYETWRLFPTSLDQPFYRPVPILQGSGIGCLRHQTIVQAEDSAGRPALYWLSDFGPYRMGQDGPQCLVDDIQDLWDTVNLAASNVVAHGIFYPAKKQIWWWIATGASNDPDTKIVFDIRKGRVAEDGRVRDGWVKHTGSSASARCSCLFSNTLAAAMSRDLKPHVGLASGTVVLKCDTADTDDAGSAFQAYVDLPDTHFAGIDYLCKVGTPIVVGAVGTHSLTVTMVRDYGEETRTGTSTAMAAAGSETRTTKVMESVVTADAHAVRVRVGDAAAVASAWTIDAVAIPVEVQERIV